MIVSNNTLLNILIPNNNSALKNVLKEADAKQLSSNTKDGTSIQSIIKNLFSDTLSGAKSNEAVQNMLKNSNIFKDMGSFTSQLKDLQNTIKNDPKLEKFESIIKNFLVNIKNLDESVLKEQVAKSGVFLESKLNDTLKTSNLPNKIENILTELKQELGKVNNPASKDISNAIDQLLNSKTNTKVSLTKDLNTILSQVKNLEELKNSPQTQNLLKQISQLTSLKNEIKLLNTAISNNQTTQPNTSQNQALTQAQPQTQTQIPKSELTRQVPEQKSTPLNQIKDALNSMKESLVKIDSPIAKQLSQEISNILSQKNVPMQNVLDQSKTIVSKLQNFIVNQPSSDNLSNIKTQNTSLKTIAYNTPNSNIKVTLETPVPNQTQNTSTQTQSVNPKINELLTTIKQTISPVESPKLQNILKEINTVLAQKSSVPSESQNNQVKTIVNKLENALVNLPSTPQTNNITQLTNTLKTVIYTQNQTSATQLQSQTPVTPQQNQTPQTLTNQQVQANPTLINDHQVVTKLNDILSNIKTELLNNNFPLSKQTIQLIDKLLAQTNITQNTALLQNNISELLTSVKTTIASSSTATFQSEPILKLLNQLETSIKPNSPLLNEKNLINNPELQKTNITNDIKSTLLQLSEELKQTNTPTANEIMKNVDKLLTQVDYYQLMSLTSSSNYIYFPFIWDMLEDGSLSMKKLNEERFFVEINLKLKEYGKVNMMLIMYDENHLDMSIFAQKDKLKNELSSHLQSLKQSLSSVGIIPGTIKLLDLKEEAKKPKEEDSFADVYTQQTGFGVDIKV